MAFNGRVVTEWLRVPKKRHRKMMLVEDFSFTDSDGKTWTATAGSIVNGISFPEWRKYYPWWKNILYTIGSIPIKIFNWSAYVSNARRSSVLHDRFCILQSSSPEATHKMFYEAMLEDDTPKWQADLFYNSVKIFKKW